MQQSGFCVRHKSFTLFDPLKSMSFVSKTDLGNRLSQLHAVHANLQIIKTISCPFQ